MALTLASQGAQGSVYVEPGASAHTFDTSSERWEFKSESIKKKLTILNAGGIRGTRSNPKEATAAGPYEVGGNLSLNNVSPYLLDFWLPRILGANESTDTFAVAETLQAFGMLFNRVGEEFEYTDCYVNKATFRGRQGELVELELEIWGVTEVPGTAIPSVAIDISAASAPYTFCQGVLTLGGTAYTMMDFEVIIDNMLERRFGNSCTATSITPKDRMVYVNCTVPFTSVEDAALYDFAHAGIAGSIALTGSAISTTFTFANLKTITESPNITGKQEIVLPLKMQAFMSSTTREIVITNDSTP